MGPHVIFRLLKQHLLWFILIPGIAAGIVFYLTRGESKAYKSQAMLYTGLASGYSLQSMLPNNQGDRSAIAFDNLLTTLNSTETQRQIGVDLLTEHLLLANPDPMVLGQEGFDKLQKDLPADLRMNLVSGHTPEQIQALVDSLSQRRDNNPVKALFLQPASYYSTALLSKKLKSNRKSTNDMLELEYETNDPAVAQKTLEYAIAVLNKRYKSLKTTETSSVIGYYDDKSEQTKQRLAEAERKRQAFAVQNKVLNFDDDAKNIADTRETTIAEYNQEMMRNQAAKASMESLKQRMGQRGTQINTGDVLKAKQDELTAAQNQLVNARAYGRDAASIAQLQAKADRIADELKTVATKFYAASGASETVPQQTLVTEWLTKVTEYEESSARLKLYAARLNANEAKTAQFSPLGAKLRQLDRELTVAEKEDLASTENLNQARTQQGDLTVNAGLTTLDKPNFPLAPQPSKRWLLIAASIGAGLFLTLFLVAIRFWLDQRVSSPEKAELVIGKPVAAMFPTVRKSAMGTKVGRAAMNMFEQLCNAINIEIVQQTGKPHPPVITIFSVRPKQGKTWTSNGLARLYADAGQQVAYFYPRNADAAVSVEQGGITFLPYTVRPDFMNVLRFENLLSDGESFVPSHYDKIILELPALVSSAIPVYLVDNSYVSVLVVDANSSWARTEKQLLGMYIRIATHPILTVLNRVEDGYLEAFSQQDVAYRLKRSETLLNGRKTLPTNV